jgi:hypothetical protein
VVDFSPGGFRGVVAVVIDDDAHLVDATGWKRQSYAVIRWLCS